MLKSIVTNYKKVSKPVINIIVADFFLQLINSSFVSIQPLYLKSVGYTDGLSAGFISYRFLGVLLLAFPIGFYIKNKKLKPLFYISGIGVPTFAIINIIAIEHKLSLLISVSQFCFGSFLAFLQIAMLPFILRNSTEYNKTESIALSFSSWSIASIVGGFFIGTLNKINNQIFSEHNLLLGISAIGYISTYFISKSTSENNVEHVTSNATTYNWKKITKALIPTSLLALGAGLTIPFISLFFSNVHHVSTANFAYLSSFASVLVVFGAMLVPQIKNNMSYRIAVPTTQLLAVLALVFMATTQYYSYTAISVYIAAFCYLLRQPLMNMAGPMT
ncbi:MAG: hypothetical protein J0M08_11740 [Bacteroidetes bacterium]|nr:hypothetical protein [Bacteroidota bacterium]